MKQEQAQAQTELLLHNFYEKKKKPNSQKHTQKKKKEPGMFRGVGLLQPIIDDMKKIRKSSCESFKTRS